MVDYQPPLRDMRFVLHELFDSAATWARPGDFASVDRELADAILSEAGRICSGLLAPLDRVGDEQGVRFEAGRVTTPDGFPPAWREFAAGGWVGLAGNPEHGGQGLPRALTLLVDEMLFAAGNSFALYAVLTSGAALLIDAHASDELRRLYLPRLYRGEWTGVMCLTEPQAGSDLGLARCRAEPSADGTYIVSGTKIFITGGEHDLADNIVHLVLARLPDAPPGSRGLSLFLVPRNLPEADGRPGGDNGVRCGGVEAKMGIHASATCTLHYEQSRGWLVGTPHRGLAAMFTMMNEERLTMGLQGLGSAEKAWQQALAYAQERRQGRAPGRPPVQPGEPDPIIAHPDVRRMLYTQKSLIEGGRAFAVWVGHLLDQARHGSGEPQRRAAARVALLTPVAKAFMTDAGLESCLLAQQVFGGHGYVREHGLEQLVRDVRISQIYEGTNGIQAMDLMERRVIADGGETLSELLDEIRAFSVGAASVAALQPLLPPLDAAVDRLAAVTRWLIEQTPRQPELPGAAAVDYLQMVGLTLYAWLWVRQAEVALPHDQPFYRGKRSSAWFFLHRVLPRTLMHEAAIRSGPGDLARL